MAIIGSKTPVLTIRMLRMERSRILVFFLLWFAFPLSAQQSIHLLEQATTDHQRMIAHRLLGKSYYDDNKYESALSGFQKALEYSHLLEMTDETLGIASRISDCQRSLGNIDAAFEVAFEALSLADSVGNYGRMGNLNNRIGELYREQHETDKAILHLKNAYEAYSIANRERGMLPSRVNLALAYKRIDAEKALETYEGVLTEFNVSFGEWEKIPRL